ncbi:MAG TPA: F0F1 ATP synthase subunit B [Longimicrobiales bacterium]
MNLLFALLQEHAPATAEHAESPNVFALTANVSFWTLVIFLILLFVLAKFAFPPILGYAAAREKRIQEAIDEAARQRAETEKLLEEQRSMLVSARTEAQGIIAEAQKNAERVRREVLDKAKTEQEELLVRAKREIEDERVRAVDSLRREAVDLAVAAASKLVEKKLDSQEDRRIVTEFLSHVETGAAVGSRS